MTKDTGYFYCIEFNNQNRIKIGITRKNNPMVRLNHYYGEWTLHLLILSHRVGWLESRVKEKLKKKYRSYKKEVFLGNCHAIKENVLSTVMKNEILNPRVREMKQQSDKEDFDSSSSVKEPTTIEPTIANQQYEEPMFEDIIIDSNGTHTKHVSLNDLK